MFLACKKAARVLVLGIALLGAAIGTHTMAQAEQGPAAADVAAVAAMPAVAAAPVLDAGSSGPGPGLAAEAAPVTSSGPGSGAAAAEAALPAAPAPVTSSGPPPS